MGNEKIMEERQELVTQIIENMKQGYILPKPDWDNRFFILNPVSNTSYKGANFLKLYLVSIKRHYTDNRWMTFKQAQSQGWKVKKGEKGVRLEKYIFDKIVEKENPETGETEKVKEMLSKPIINTFVVFNASQIEGVPEMEPERKLEHDEVMEIAENFIASSECSIIETNEGRAYYSPSLDKIILPFRNAFIDQTSFLSTQLHEMVHSTGHPTRLNRDIQNKFGSSDYAKEELRAELGSFFIQTDLGISLDAQHFNSHTHYLKSWISALENDPNELYRAISDAQKAATYLEERYERYLENIKAKDELKNDNPQAPYIKCEWSESLVFEKGKVYSVEEFDRVMKQADTDWVEKRKQEIETYGDDTEAVWEAYKRGDIDGVHLGYEKVKYTIFMPDGTSFPTRQDIGDGDGGVISFLQSIGQEELAKELERVVVTKGVSTETKDEKIAACKKRLRELADFVYKGNVLAPASMHALARRYGVDTMDRILASSLVTLEDNRVSSINMSWAKVYCENKGMDKEAALITEDAAVLNQMTNQFRAYEKQLNDNMTALHFSPQDMLGVYQLKGGNEELEFVSTSDLLRKEVEISAENYECIYATQVTDEKMLNPETVFQILNDNERPSNYLGHSLSVSDILVYRHEDKYEELYVDSIGFTPVALHNQRVQSRRSANKFRAETEKKYISVAGETYKEVENLASEHIFSRLQEEGLDIFVADVILTGSRSRGIATENSDLDFVVAYEGDIREDDLFSLLNAGDFAIEGMQVDFNPIRNEDIPEYLISAEQYLNEKERGNMAQVEAKDVLFCYKANGFEAYYNMGDIELEDLRHLYWQIKQPFVNMPGKKLTEAEHAEMEQSNQVRMSVTADVDNNEWTVYEINGIPEDERTDFNTEIKTSILDYDKDMLYANLTNQEAAALRMALKHEMKQPGSGEQHLEAWIEKLQFQRKELGLPLQNKQMDLMRTMYRQMDIIQKLGRLETDKELPVHMRLTKWNENNHVFEPVTKILSADSTELYNNKFQKQLEYLQGSKTGKGKLFIPEKELNSVYQAKGWERYGDGSGRLVDVNGKTLVSFDLETKELMGKNLPFTEHELYKNYSYDSCGFERIREDAVRCLNNNYESALKRAKEIVEPYRQDEENFFKVSETENPEYPFNVEKINNGRCGFGKRCRSVEEVKEFVSIFKETQNKSVFKATPVKKARCSR